MPRFFVLRSYALPLLLLFTALFTQLAGPEATALLRYEQSFITDGELWRLLSAHLVHLDWTHFWMNAAALVFIWILVGDFLTQTEWVSTLFASAVGITLGFYLFMPSLQWYVGLSGVLHALLICGALMGTVQKDRLSMILLTGIIVKLMAEHFYGAFSSEVIVGSVVTESHLFGALMGMASAFVIGLRRKFSS